MLRKALVDNVAVRRICLAGVSLATLAATVYALAAPYTSPH
jgi:hypothetical protein